MATTTTSFGFGNTTAHTKVATKPVDVALLTNYGKIEDEADSVKYSNKTCLGQREIISFGAKNLNKISADPDLKWINRPKTDSASQYVVKVEDLLRTTDANGAVIQDDCIVSYIIIKHNDSPYITAAHIDTVINRLMGALQKEDGTSRVADLMAGALTVTAN